MSRPTSFDVLPLEIANNVCGFLRQSEVSRLSLATKPIYQLVRPILYRRPNVTSFASLALFQRTITQATYMGKADRQWSTNECLDQTRALDLTIDPTTDSARNNGEPPAAIMVSRMIQAIVRRCPNIAITLRFAHCQCTRTPVSKLQNETFPCVTRLMIYVGNHEPDESHANDHGDPRTRRLIPCSPNVNFWRPFVDGMCFPDCKTLEIRHYWAAAPPDHASLNLRKAYNWDTFGGPPGGHYNPRTGRSAPSGPQLGNTHGLKKLESIVLECPPELNSSLFMQLLGNPDSVAANLKKLELRFCNLDDETTSKLLYHSPPHLEHLVLLCSPRYSHHNSIRQGEVHICPLIREYAKRLITLEFAARTVCRELFFDDQELQALRHGGITTGIGAHGGTIEGSEKLDAHLIRDTVQACRRQKRTRFRNERIKEAVTIAKAQSSCASNQACLFGGAVNPKNAAVKAQRDVEFLLDEEEQKRSRLLEGSKTRWFRRIIAWHGLCDPNATWAEIQIAADMEEKGIEWVIVNKQLQIASQHANGKASIGLAMSHALEEKFDFEPRVAPGLGSLGDPDSDLEEDEDEP